MRESRGMGIIKKGKRKKRPPVLVPESKKPPSKPAPPRLGPPMKQLKPRRWPKELD